MMDIIFLLNDYFYVVILLICWQDNDVYGNVNNVVFYSFFDIVVNCFLVDEVGMDFRYSLVIVYVVSLQCQFILNIFYLEDVEVGVCVVKIGCSLVIYGVLIYVGINQCCVVYGQFVQVFVDCMMNCVV